MTYENRTVKFYLIESYDQSYTYTYVCLIFSESCIYSMPDQILAHSIENIKNGEYCTSFGCCPHVIFPIYYFFSRKRYKKLYF
jgi:hypothetical protein